MVPWKKTLTIPSLRKNDHRTGLGTANDNANANARSNWTEQGAWNLFSLVRLVLQKTKMLIQNSIAAPGRMFLNSSRARV